MASNPPLLPSSGLKEPRLEGARIAFCLSAEAGGVLLERELGKATSFSVSFCTVPDFPLEKEELEQYGREIEKPHHTSLHFESAE